MTAYEITVAGLQDLTEFTVACGNCGVKVMLTIGHFNPLEHCSSCKTAFDEHVRNALAAIERVRREGSLTKYVIEFRIRGTHKERD